MMVVKVILLAIVALFACVQGDFTPEDKQFLKKVFADVPVEARQEFLIRQLHLGYILTHPEPVYSVDESVTSKLFEILMEKSNESDKLLTQICFDDATCVDTDVPGVFPL